MDQRWWILYWKWRSWWSVWLGIIAFSPIARTHSAAARCTCSPIYLQTQAKSVKNPSEISLETQAIAQKSLRNLGKFRVWWRSPREPPENPQKKPRKSFCDGDCLRSHPTLPARGRPGRSSFFNRIIAILFEESSFSIGESSFSIETFSFSIEESSFFKRETDLVDGHRALRLQCDGPRPLYRKDNRFYIKSISFSINSTNSVKRSTTSALKSVIFRMNSTNSVHKSTSSVY